MFTYQEAINEYRGTVITVSHDRYFIRQIVNRVLEIKDGTIQDYAGDYNVIQSPRFFVDGLYQTVILLYDFLEYRHCNYLF